MAGTYITPCSPGATTTMLMKPETCIQVGTGRLYNSLETTSWAYSTYDASVGMKDGQSFQLGVVADLTFSHKPTFEAVESFNISDNSIYEVMGEETTVSVTIRQFDPRIFELAVGTGTMYTLGAERLMTFGGGCTMLRRPYSFEFTNDSCWAPTSQDITTGISGGAITLYDCFIQSGLEWTMTAKEGNTLPLELQALPVLDRARGNRLGCMSLY